MKFDQKYPWGENPPFSDYRRLIAYVSDQHFACVKCGERTSWVCAYLMTATCSDECLLKQIVQGPAVGPTGHWLTKDVSSGDTTGHHQLLPGEVHATSNA